MTLSQLRTDRIPAVSYYIFKTHLAEVTSTIAGSCLLERSVSRWSLAKVTAVPPRTPDLEERSPGLDKEMSHEGVVGDD